MNSIFSICSTGKLEDLKKIVKEGQCSGSISDDKYLLQACNVHGMNSLHCASYFGHLNIVKYLVENSLVPIDSLSNSPHGTFATALHYAVAANERKVVRYLLENDANPFIKDYRGHTALSIAHMHQHKKVAKLLQEFIQSRNEKYSLSNDISGKRLALSSPAFSCNYASVRSWNDFKQEHLREVEDFLKKSSSLVA